MDELLQEIRRDVKRMASLLDEVRLDQRDIKKDVAYHIRRTTLLERIVSALSARVAGIEKLISQAGGLLTLLKWLSLTAAFIGVVLSIAHLLGRL